MRIIYNRLIPVKGFTAMAFFGVILARKECAPLSYSVVNHEKIHLAQARDCGGWLRFYVKYLAYWVRFGYRGNPFECEAYSNGWDNYYLIHRQPRAWKKYLKP